MQRIIFRYRTLAIVMLCYFAIAAALYFLGGEQFHVKTVTTDDMVTPTDSVGEVTSADYAEQPFTLDADRITGVKLIFATYARSNSAKITISVRDNEKTLAATTLDTSSLTDNAEQYIPFQTAADITPGDQLFLTVSSEDAVPGNAVTVYYGSSISVTKGSVKKEISDSEKAIFDGKKVDGILCFQALGERDLLFGRIYWYLAIILGVLLALYGTILTHKAETGRTSPMLRFFAAIRRYKFLMQQLVNRDFKAKYKRSVLGILWSFLNPLLMMTVQYVVFSTLFKSNIANFPLYLLTGIVCFNFFNESTSMSLQSIVGNAALITKVYVPKYIYPVTRVMSSTINFLLSLIPLALVMIIMGTPFRVQNILIIYGILCLEMLSLGIGMMLASAMVFFRDVQFIWGVLITILNFATPIFYPDSIIPAKYMTVYKMNPLYHIVRFIRICIMDGVSPEPKAYLFCLIGALVPLVLGIYVFKKTQDKFVLYI